MPTIVIPDANAPFVMPDGKVNPVWHRFLMVLTGLLRQEPALGDYTASMIETTGGSTVQAELTALDAAVDSCAPLARSLTAGTGLSGGGQLASDMTFAVDISELTEVAVIDKAKDYFMMLDATDSTLKKITPTNMGL